MLIKQHKKEEMVKTRKKKFLSLGYLVLMEKKGGGKWDIYIYIYIKEREREREKSGQVFYFFLLTYIFKQGYKKDTSALQGPNP